MEQTPLPPLVSDEQIERYPIHAESGELVAITRMPIKAMRDIYEADCQRTREVVQSLVDDMHRLRMEFGHRTGTTTQIGVASIALAKSQLQIRTDQMSDKEKNKRQQMPYPAHTAKDIRVRATAYADHIANKGTVGHENAFYDFLNGAIWERDRQSKQPDIR